MKTEKLSLKNLFTSGQIQKVYGRFLKNDFDKPDLTWIIGALCFLGKWDEAISLTKKRKLQSCELFFMLTISVRRGDYLFAKKILGELSKRSLGSEENKFFYYQSLAFYAYYQSRYKMALYFAQKGHVNSLNSTDSFWRILSLDLLGHAFVQMGDIHKGIYYLEEASALAFYIENKTFQEATNISIINYQAQFTKKPKEMIVILEKELKKIARNDNYSEGSMLLSLVHLYLLVGEMQEAEKILLKAQATIFGTSTLRHMAHWYFERAYFHYLEGKSDLSINFLDLAENHCPEKSEMKLLLKIWGLKRKIFLELNKQTGDIDQKILKLTLFLGDPRGRNHLARLGQLPKEISEDPLQLFFDDWGSDHWQKSLSTLIESHYFGLLREKMVKRSHSYFVTGLWKNGLLILTPLGIYKGQASELLLKALILLAKYSSVSKEELVEQLWGHEYDPLRHDTLLYSLIHRLRLLLGPYEKDLVGENHCYFFTHHFEWLEISVREKEKHLGKPAEGHLKMNKSWNIRQHKVMSFIHSGETFQVSDYALKFNVSLMTALRDLTELVNDGKIKKYGRARATTYGS